MTTSDTWDLMNYERERDYTIYREPERVSREPERSVKTTVTNKNEQLYSFVSMHCSKCDFSSTCEHIAEIQSLITQHYETNNVEQKEEKEEEKKEEKEEKEEEEDNLCIVCVNKPRTEKCNPCGHCLVCRDCSYQMKGKRNASVAGKCIYCQSTIASVTSISPVSNNNVSNNNNDFTVASTAREKCQKCNVELINESESLGGSNSNSYSLVWKQCPKCGNKSSYETITD